LKQPDMDNSKSYSHLEVVSEMKNPALSSGVFHYYDQFSQFKTTPTVGKVCPPS
jgi:hypothetical protein